MLGQSIFKLILTSALSMTLVAMSSPARALAPTCESLFRTAHVEEFLTPTARLPNEIQNPRLQASIVMALEHFLPAGSYDVTEGDQAHGLSVQYDGNGNVQMRLGQQHLAQSQPIPLLQSQWGGVRGSRSGLWVRTQLPTTDRFIITNTIIAGDENTYLGLTKKEIRTELDMSNGPITEITVTETVTTTSAYRKDDTTYTVSRKIKILSRPWGNRNHGFRRINRDRGNQAPRLRELKSKSTQAG